MFGEELVKVIWGTADVGALPRSEKRRKRSYKSDSLVGKEKQATRQTNRMGSRAELVDRNSSGEINSNSGVIQVLFRCYFQHQ